MTRKRTGDPLAVQLQSVCPYCEGRGRIVSVETTTERIEERLKELSATGTGSVFRVTCSPLVCLHVIGEAGNEIDLLEEELGVEVHVRCSADMHPERFVVKAGAPDGLKENGLPFAEGEVIKVEPAAALDIPSEGLMAVLDGCIVHVPDAPHVIDQPQNVRLAEVSRSYLRGTVAKRKSRRRRRSSRRRSKKKAPAAEGAEKAPESSE